MGGSGSERKVKLAYGDVGRRLVDTIEEKSVVAIRPKPAFRPIFEVATTRAGSGIVLTNEPPPDCESPEAVSPYSLVETGEGRTPRPEGTVSGYTTSLFGGLFSSLEATTDEVLERPAD